MMNKFVIQLETNLDLIDLAKLINKYEKLGAVKLISIIESTKPSIIKYNER